MFLLLLEAINGIVVLVKNEHPMFTNIANSMTNINNIGSDIDESTNIIITNITAIDTVFTFLKSWSLISTKSFH